MRPNCIDAPPRTGAESDTTRLTPSGHLDTDFYIAKGRRLQAATALAALRALVGMPARTRSKAASARTEPRTARSRPSAGSMLRGDRRRRNGDLRWKETKKVA